MRSPTPYVIAASTMPTTVISSPVAHHGRIVTRALDAPTAKCATVLMMNDAITAGMPTVKKKGMIGMNPPTAVRQRGRNRRPDRIWKRLFREAEFLMDQRPQELLRLLLNALGHRVCFVGREALELVEQFQLEQLFVRILFDLRPLPSDLRLVDFAFGLGGEIGAGTHRERAGQRAGESGREHHFASAGVPGHPGDDAEHRPEAIVHPVNGIADPAGAAHVPALTPQDGVECRSWRRHRSAGKTSQDDGVVGFFEFGVLRDLPVLRVAESRHEQVVLRFGAVLLLLQAVQDDRRIGDALEPREAALHFLAVRAPAGGGLDPIRPACGVVVFLIGEAVQDVTPLRVALPLGEMPIGGGGLDLAPPHLLDDREA